MNAGLLGLGIAILLLVSFDFVITTVSTSGSGWLSHLLSKGTWEVLFRIAGRRGRNRLLNFAGILCTGVLLTAWVGLIWTGNSLMYCAFPESVRHSGTGEIASVVDKFYFVGYTLSTVGYGDFHPATPFWKLYSVFIGLSGLMVMSLAITYLVQVITAENEKKRLSLYIASMGETPQQLLLHGWNGKDLSNLNTYFAQLSEMILAHSQHHLAFPLLRYFHSASPPESTALMLVTLDEALHIIRLHIPEKCRPDQIVLVSLDRALSNYLLTLEKDLIRSNDEPLDLPLTDQLAARGVPIENLPVPSNDHQYVRRRRLLKAILRHVGWNWQDVNVAKDKQEGLDFLFTPSPDEADE